MEVLGLLIGLVLATLLGNCFVFLFDRDRALGALESIALSFLLGQGLITILLFWSFFFIFPFRAYFIAAGIIILFVLKSFYARWDSLRTRALSIKQWFAANRIFNVKSLAWLLLLLLVFLKLSYSFVEAGSKPEFSWDACGHWTAPAKDVFYADKFHKIPPNFYLNKSAAVYFYYPKQVTYMHYWLFALMGKVNDQWSKIIFPLTLLCFCVFFYGSLKKERGSLGALLFTYLLFSAPLFLYHSTIGYADFTLAVYFSSGIILFYRWLKEKQGVYFWLFSFFLALTTWIKLEGKTLWIVGLLLLLFYLIFSCREKLWPKVRMFLQYLGAFALIGLPWQLFVFFSNVTTREKFALHINYFFEFHNKIFNSLFLEGSWGVFWFLCLAILFFFGQNFLQREKIYLLLAGLLFYAMTVFIYLFTFDAYGYYTVTFNRVWLAIYPVVVFSLACLVPKLGSRDV